MSRAQRSDGNVTKAKILDTAGNLIAQHGFAHTPNKLIAQTAQVDLAAINYHFSGREGLYKAVLKEAHTHYLDEKDLAELAEKTLCAEDKLTQFFELIVYKITQEDVWHAKVFVHEMFSPSAYFLQFMAEEGGKKFHLIKKIMSQVSGFSEDDPQLFTSLLNIIAPCLMLILIRSNQRSPLYPVSDMHPQALVEHLKTFTIGGLNALALSK